jgi:hypothetical protein
MRPPVPSEPVATGMPLAPGTRGTTARRSDARGPWPYRAHRPRPCPPARWDPQARNGPQAPSPRGAGASARAYRCAVDVPLASRVSPCGIRDIRPAPVSRPQRAERWASCSLVHAAWDGSPPPHSTPSGHVRCGARRCRAPPAAPHATHGLFWRSVASLLPEDAARRKSAVPQSAPGGPPLCCVTQTPCIDRKAIQ